MIWKENKTKEAQNRIFAENVNIVVRKKDKEKKIFS